MCVSLSLCIVRFEFEEGINESSVEEELGGVGVEEGELDPSHPFDLGEIYGYGDSVKFVRNGATDDAFSYYMMKRYTDESLEDSSRFVAVDPHILATPSMADINRDGHMEVREIKR